MRTEVRIAGFGGQGVIMAGVIIGKAASLFDNKNAVQTQSYGPEARGGASRTEVVIDDDEIDYPKVTSPDILVAMSHEALIKYMGDLKDEGVLIIDPDMIVEEEIVEPEVEPVKDSKGIKEYTEEELIVMPRDELNQVIADIKAGKAKCKPRIL